MYRYSSAHSPPSYTFSNLCTVSPSFEAAGQSSKCYGQPRFLRGGNWGAAGRPGLQKHSQTQTAEIQARSDSQTRIVSQHKHGAYFIIFISNLLGFFSVCVVLSCPYCISCCFFPTSDLDELILHGELRHLTSPPQSSSTKPSKPAATQPSPPAFIKEKGFHYYLSVDRCAYTV